MPGIDADIQQLWDELADFDAAHSDQTMHHLLNFLNEDLHAINVLWFVAIHLHSLKPDDPVFGWRPRVHGYLYPDAALEKRSRDAKQSIECGKINPSMIRNAALAGQWRANRLVDLVEPEWFESEFYRDYHLAHNHGDAIWLACPINEDSEVYFGIFRSNDAPRFSPEDRDRSLRIVCGLKWMLRQLLLSYGVGIGNKSLTPAERNVLHGLLTDRPEPLIAEDLAQNPATMHEHVKSIYRKFGISSRAMLMALWLGRKLQ